MTTNSTKTPTDTFPGLRPERDKGSYGWRMWNEIEADDFNEKDSDRAPEHCGDHLHGTRDATEGRRCRDCGAAIR